MFLVNSRRSRSSAAAPEGSAPSTEGTGPFCRVPSRGFSRTPSDARLAHLCRFAVRADGSSGQGFSRPTPRGLPDECRRPCGTGASITPIPSVSASPAVNLPIGCGNVRPLPIGDALQPGLRSRLTLGGLPFPRKPGAFGGPASHRPCRYSFRHTHSTALHHPSPVWLRRGRRRSPTTGLAANPRLRRDA